MLMKFNVVNVKVFGYIQVECLNFIRKHKKRYNSIISNDESDEENESNCNTLNIEHLFNKISCKNR